MRRAAVPDRKALNRYACHYWYDASVRWSAGIWIGRVLVPESVEAKLRNRRGVTGAQVRAACEWPAAVLRTAWHEHPEHGRRLVVFARDEQGRLLKVVLHPADVADGTWILKTAVIAGRAGAS